MKPSSIVLVFMLIGIMILMCYNLITRYGTPDNLKMEHFASGKLGKFKSIASSNGEKFANLNIKANRTSKKTKNNKFSNKFTDKNTNKSTEKFDDMTNNVTDKGLLNQAMNIFKGGNTGKSGKRNTHVNSDSRYTIDDVIDRSEKLERGISKISTDNLKTQAIDYYKSFKKEKFSASSGSTAEALDKFKLYKEKFFEIFKKN